MNLVKVAVPMNHLKTMRRWLQMNCGRRWTASDYAHKPFNWRVLSKLPDDGDEYFDVTAWVEFTKREDMMLFLLVWPGEVAVYDTNDSVSLLSSDKYTCYTKVTPVSNLISA